MIKNHWRRGTKNIHLCPEKWQQPSCSTLLMINEKKRIWIQIRKAELGLKTTGNWVDWWKRRRVWRKEAAGIKKRKQEIEQRKISLEDKQLFIYNENQNVFLCILERRVHCLEKRHSCSLHFEQCNHVHKIFADMPSRVAQPLAINTLIVWYR